MPFDDTSPHEGTTDPFARPTLADIRKSVAEDARLTEEQRYNINWALKALEERFKRDLATIPADADAIERLARELARDPRGLSRPSIGNLASRLRSAVQHYALKPEPLSALPATARRSGPRVPMEMSQHWSGLLARIPRKFPPFQLEHFARWCTAEGMEPDEVTAEIVETYAATAIGRMKYPVRHMRILRSVWNRATSDVPGWPQLLLEGVPRRELVGIAEAEMAPEL